VTPYQREIFAILFWRRIQWISVWGIVFAPLLLFLHLGVEGFLFTWALLLVLMAVAHFKRKAHQIQAAAHEHNSYSDPT